MVVPADVDDLIQESLLRAYSGIDQLNDPAKLKYWIFSIMRNVLKDHLRVRQRLSEISLDDEQFKGRLEQLRDKQRREVGGFGRFLQKLLDGLPEKHRDAPIDQYVQGLSVKESATKLGVTPNTVLSYRHRAIQKLKSAFENHGASREGQL